MKGVILTKKFILIAISALLILTVNPVAMAGGLFGPPQTISKEAGGLNTAVGYRYHEDTFKGDTEHVVRQNQIYSQAAYGSADRWEIYGRIGLSDLKMFDAFTSTDASTATYKNNFEENWKLFGTLGAKGFYPFNGIFGIGAFIQGSYHFSSYTDEFVGVRNAVPFVADLNIKNFWDVNFGLGLQATVPYGIKLYAGPYVYYARADATLSSAIPGIQSGNQDVLWKNKSIAGGFCGVDIPLTRGFRLNIEGQYTDRFSVGSAITYTY
ncbi:MAG: hypothetical protein CVU71_07500 [Deltaproteobacteria bacterium HGW-Deltaproteobacteria-6]|jgi:hypothetical protein|nr:MAG: hypothetical protein CVU71_07500 [Deltaproteobacteria bacterium HGW-Deltaproteobacteria-6]